MTRTTAPLPSVVPLKKPLSTAPRAVAQRAATAARVADATRRALARKDAADEAARQAALVPAAERQQKKRSDDRSYYDAIDAARKKSAAQASRKRRLATQEREAAEDQPRPRAAGAPRRKEKCASLYVTSVRLTRDEHLKATANATAAGLSLSDFNRACLTGNVPLHVPRPKVIELPSSIDLQAARDLAHMARLANQVAKAANTIAGADVITAKMTKDFYDASTTMKDYCLGHSTTAVVAGGARKILSTAWRVVTGTE